MDNLSHFFHKSEGTLSKPFFFYTFFVCFIFQAQGYLETCVNGVTNCKTSLRALVPLLPGETQLDIGSLPLDFAITVELNIWVKILLNFGCPKIG